jgi:hypothetical protein
VGLEGTCPFVLTSQVISGAIWQSGGSPTFLYPLEGHWIEYGSKHVDDIRSLEPLALDKGVHGGVAMVSFLGSLFSLLGNGSLQVVPSHWEGHPFSPSPDEERLYSAGVDW